MGYTKRVKRKILQKTLFFFFFILIIFAGHCLITQVLALSLPERKIVVFKEEIKAKSQNDLFAQMKIVPNKRLRLVNAQSALLSPQQTEWLLKDSRVLRIEPDVQVYALPREDLCTRFPWLPWCSPSPTPTPTPIPTATPTPTPTPTPTATPIPTPTPTPPPSPSPSLSPSPSPSSSPSPTPTPIAGSQPLPWGIEKIQADEAWSTSRGKGVKVAILDTGIDIDHPDLDDNLAGCQNFISWYRNCDDDNGHGTHVAGIIAAEDNDFGVVGVAPEARLYALKVLNRNGSGYLSDILEALDWAITNDMDVVSMSLGTNSDIQSFHQAIQKVNQAGIVIVAAGGNDGPGNNTVDYPAAYSEVMAVAATDSSNNVPSWSSRGAEIDLAAPGVNVYSTYLRGGYQTMSGTSMSTPHVTGVVALRLQNHPNESPSTLESVLETTATSLPFDSTVVGAGLVNAYQAVNH
jgi:subtilisin family serine protease